MSYLLRYLEGDLATAKVPAKFSEGGDDLPSATSSELLALELRAKADLCLIQRLQNDFEGAAKTASEIVARVDEAHDIPASVKHQLNIASLVDLSLNLTVAGERERAAKVVESISRGVGDMPDPLERSIAHAAVSAVQSANGAHMAAARASELACKEAESARKIEDEDDAFSAEISARKSAAVDYINLRMQDRAAEHARLAEVRARELRQRQEEARLKAETDDEDREVGRVAARAAAANLVPDGSYNDTVEVFLPRFHRQVDATGRLPRTLSRKDIKNWRVELIFPRQGVPRFSQETSNLDDTPKINIHIRTTIKRRLFRPGRYIFAYYINEPKRQ
jgi:hypothetical protein